MDFKKKLYNLVKKEIEKIEDDDIALSFSGGVDSSLLARICKDTGKKISLITVTFEKERDKLVAEEAAKILDLAFYHVDVDSNQVEKTLADLIKKIEYKKS